MTADSKAFPGLEPPPDIQAAAAALAQWPSNFPPLFAQNPTPELVIETLDSEMARLEQAVSRSGWTSWAGTAALGGLAWVFVTLLDDTPHFPWSTLVLLTTLLSSIQDFIYGLNDVLRPRRGRGLLVGGQTRMMFTRETLPFARKLYSFDLTRAALLALSSYLVLPASLGWLWWLPFIAYLLTCVVMLANIVVSTLRRAIPKQEKFYFRVLVRQFAPACVAVAALVDLAGSWHAADFVVLKGALIIIAASHVLRGLARPQFELPALDTLREVRRRLGFGQITAVRAIEQAEAALYGHSSIRVLSHKLKAFTGGCQGFTREIRDMVERVATLTKHMETLGRAAPVTEDHIRIGEALVRDTLVVQGALLATSATLAETRQTLIERLDQFKKNTSNDTSIPILDTLIKIGTAALAVGAFKAGIAAKFIAIHTSTLARLASTHNLPLAPQLQAEVNAAEANFTAQMTALRQTAGVAAIPQEETT